MNATRYNLLVTLNTHYLKPLCVMLKSALVSNPEAVFDIYVIHSSLTDTDFDTVRQTVKSDRLMLFPISIKDDMLKSAPTSKRFPKEMYYRLFSSRYLPDHLDRILYLDPDIVIINSLATLYNMPMDKHLFVACSHIVIKGLQKINELRLNMVKNTPYINSGVLLMNLAELRKELNPDDVLSYIRKHKKVLMLPDQDVLSGLYGSKTLLVDSLVYNLSERFLRETKFRLFPGTDKIDFPWIRENSVIIHYCGRNKPWKKLYIGCLKQFYLEAEQELKR